RKRSPLQASKPAAAGRGWSGPSKTLDEIESCSCKASDVRALAAERPAAPSANLARLVYPSAYSFSKDLRRREGLSKELKRGAIATLLFFGPPAPTVIILFRNLPSNWLKYSISIILGVCRVTTAS